MGKQEPYIGLARQYRPQTFADLVGQDQIAHSLAHQIVSDKVGQAYIFSGPRGIGKTSAARILAKSLNCLEGPTPSPCGKCEQCVSITSGNSMDVIEIDGASNNGVDDIRDLQESVNQNPFAARKKIYIIDEVHMLSKGAFNALLKTLEEPPPFVIFIFATTEFEKIPETIKSRCQPFMFSRISTEDLIRRLKYVAEQEKMEMDPGESLAIFETIAYAVDGGMRDAMMALDQLRALGDGKMRLDDVTRFLGVVEHDQLLRTVEMLHQRNTRGLLELINTLVDRGRDLERFIKNLLSFLRDLMILKSGGGEGLVSMTGEKLARAQKLLWTQGETGRRDEVLSYAELLNFIQIFMSLEADIKAAVQVRIHLEFAFVKLTAIEPVVDITHLLANLDRMPVGAGSPAPAAPQQPTRQQPPAAPPAGGGQPTHQAPPPPPASRPQPQVPPPAPRPVAPQSPPEPQTPDLFGRVAQRQQEPELAQAAPHAAGGPIDAAMLWQQTVSARNQLGKGIAVAVNKAQFLSADGNRIFIGYPKTSLFSRTLNDPIKHQALETLVSQLAGQPMAIVVKTVPSSTVAPQAAPQPVMVMHDSTPSPPPPPEFETEEDYSDEDTVELFLRQNPLARTHDAVRNNPVFREKVEMVKRFFDGQIFDPSGKEIVLE